MTKIYILPTRLSEPTYKSTEGPIWQQFSQDPKAWAAKALHARKSPWRYSKEAHLSGADTAGCLAVTSTDEEVLRPIINHLLEEWGEVYTIHGPSYGIYSKLLMGAIRNGLDLYSWTNRARGDSFFTNALHLSNFFEAQDMGKREANLPVSKYTEDYLDKVEEGGAGDFTLLSPFLPQSLMLSFFHKISSKIELHYKVGSEVQALNILEEFANNCVQLESLHTAGCLSCVYNSECVPFLTDNQVDYGFRKSIKEITQTGNKIAQTLGLGFAPIGSFRFLYPEAYRFHDGNGYNKGNPRSTEQGLLLRGTTKPSIASLLDRYLSYKQVVSREKTFREKECSRCLLEGSCESLGLNKSSPAQGGDISKECSGALTKQSDGLESTLLAIVIRLHIFTKDSEESSTSGLVSRFADLLYNQFSSLAISSYAKIAAQVLSANSKYFYGSILLPTCMVEFIEDCLSSHVPNSLMFSWANSINRSKFVAESTARIHTGVAGLQKFSSTSLDSWSILLPTHDYYGSVEREFSSSDETPWYVSITTEEFVTTYGDLPKDRVPTSFWGRDKTARVLYLMKAFSDITLPKTVECRGSFGVYKSLAPVRSYEVSIPSNGFLRSLSKSVDIIDVLDNYITIFVSMANQVSWPAAIVRDAFQIKERS